RRYASAQELADELDRWARGEAIRARPTSFWGRAVKWARRRPALAALGAAVVTAVVGLGVLGALWALERARATEVELNAAVERAAQQEQLAAEQRRRVAEVSAALKKAQEREQQALASDLHTRRTLYNQQLGLVAATYDRDPRFAVELLHD